jgi:opacity protein-like surface antigen
VKGALKGTAEYTFIGYNTNMQNRDVKNQFPDFLYTHGFTDTTAFTADSDYANVYDRGKDPRSVYTQWQDRHTQVAVLNGQVLVPRLPGGVLAVKLKYVHDQDGRQTGNRNDDYIGNAYLAFAQLAVQPTAELRTTLGYEYSYWNEKKRAGTESSGFFDARTARHTARAGLSYSFSGALLTYTLEYFHKDLLRDHRAYYDMVWNVLRSKATFEVSW